MVKTKFKNLHLINHPLLQHKLTLLREAKTPSKIFKELLKEITFLLAYDITKNLKLSSIKIKTPVANTTGKIIATTPVIVPILRAGLGMVDGFLTLIPWAKVGHIGLFRDEVTLKPHQYYFKMPKQKNLGPYFICDPMLATGGSIVSAIDLLKKSGVRDIVVVCVVAAPEGVKRVLKAHPKIPIFAVSLDQKLNHKGYIVPGLGDAGDRLFDTK
jgi:uracil phosphoribosyltransferase